MKNNLKYLTIVSLYFLGSCDIPSKTKTNQNQEAELMPKEQTDFYNNLKAGYNLITDQSFHGAERVDSILNVMNRFADSSIILGWVGIIDEVSTDFNYRTSNGGNYVALKVHITPFPTSYISTISSDIYVEKDSIKTNYIYNQFSKGNFKKGDTIIFDGLFKLYSIDERKLINHINEPYGNAKDLIVPWFKIDLTSIKPYKTPNNDKLIELKRSTDSIYKYAKIIASRGLYNSDETKVSLRKVTANIEKFAKGDNAAEVYYLIDRRVIREINLIK